MSLHYNTKPVALGWVVAEANALLLCDRQEARLLSIFPSIADVSPQQYHCLPFPTITGGPRRWKRCKGCCDAWTRSRYVFLCLLSLPPSLPPPHTHAYSPPSPSNTYSKGLVRAGPAVPGQESTTAHLHTLPTPPLPVPLLPPLAPGPVFERLAAGGVWGVLPSECLLLPGKVRNERVEREARSNPT